MFITLVILLSRALLTLFYYLRIGITSIILSGPKRKWVKSSSKFNATFMTPVLIFVNSVGIFTPAIISSII